MAHTALHFSLGVVIASAVMLPAVGKAWRGGTAVARVIARWLVAAYTLGIYAVIPSLLGWIGLPAACCGGWWMNAFLLHPLLNRWVTGGMIAAGAAIVVCFGAPYLVLLAAVWRARTFEDSMRGSLDHRTHESPN